MQPFVTIALENGKGAKFGTNKADTRLKIDLVTF